jgi:hypothetical protein
MKQWRRRVIKIYGTGEQEMKHWTRRVIKIKKIKRIGNLKN